MFTLNNQIHGYNTRSKQHYHIPTVRTKLKQYSLRYQGPTLFNDLDGDIKESSSYEIFTKKLKAHLISMY